MIDYTTLQKKQLLERYKTLLPELKSLIDYGTVDLVLKELSEEFDFSNEQKILLENEILLIILLILPIAGLAERISDSLGLKPEKATYLANYCQSYLFDLEKELFLETEKQFAEKTSEEESYSPAIPLQTTPENIPHHGYGAGLANEEPAHTSSQDDIVPLDKPKNPQQTFNSNF